MLPGLLLASDLRRLGYDTRSLPRAVGRGTLCRLLRGAYVESIVWGEADAREGHILLLRAIDGTPAAQPVFSHASAAALHGLPVLGRWPTTGHVSAEQPGRSRNGVTHHQGRVGRTPDYVDGLACTTLVEDRIRRTKVDVSRWGWKTAFELPRLYEQLFAAGLRPASHR